MLTNLIHNAVCKNKVCVLLSNPDTNKNSQVYEVEAAALADTHQDRTGIFHHI